MTLTPISSPLLSKAGHEDDILCIAFVGGVMHLYFDVPEAVFRELLALAGEAADRYYKEHILDVYRHSRIR